MSFAFAPCYHVGNQTMLELETISGDGSRPEVQK
jgi:hypothetical protein